jgi:hypothetical protein
MSAPLDPARDRLAHLEVLAAEYQSLKWAVRRLKANDADLPEWAGKRDRALRALAGALRRHGRAFDCSDGRRYSYNKADDDVWVGDQKDGLVDTHKAPKARVSPQVDRPTPRVTRKSGRGA